VDVGEILEQKEKEESWWWELFGLASRVA